MRIILVPGEGDRGAWLLVSFHLTISEEKFRDLTPSPNNYLYNI